MRFITVILLVLSISFSLSAKEIKVGDVPPSYIGKTLDGEKIQLSEMKGKIVVVTFWATWCAPCMAELPILYALQQQVSSERLQVVAVNYGESKGKVKKIMSLLADTNILFTRDRIKRASKRFGVSGIPHMVIVDHEGKVAHIHIGYGDESLDRMVNELNALMIAAPRVIFNPVVKKKDS